MADVRLGEAPQAPGGSHVLREVRAHLALAACRRPQEPREPRVPAGNTQPGRLLHDRGRLGVSIQFCCTIY